MISLSIVLLLFGVRCFDSTGESDKKKRTEKCQVNDDSPITISSTIDSLLNINVTVEKKPFFTGYVTGYKLYYTKDTSQTNDEYSKWNQQEVLSRDNLYHFWIDARRNSIVKGMTFRARATIFFNNVESIPTGVLTVQTKLAAPKAPLIVNTKILHNSSVLISFVSADDVEPVENYTLMYKKTEEDEWKASNFQSDVDGKVLLDGLTPNQTYEIKMFVTGDAVQGIPSNSASFTTNTTALALVKTEPEEEYSADPQTNEPLSIMCTVKSVSKATVLWKVNGIKVSVDSSFYTVVTSVHEDFIESTIRAKSRTRSAKFTCIASNDAGDSAKDVNVIIKGPGSPPSEITLVAEIRGYTISWKPPSHPNGKITKYVVYHTLNRDDPLSDWKKIDLDGSEKYVQIYMDTEESFYGRVQAATELGPGIISDIVAMERDTQPISVESDIGGVSATTMVVNPREQVKNFSLKCYFFYFKSQSTVPPVASPAHRYQLQPVIEKMRVMWKWMSGIVFKPRHLLASFPQCTISQCSLRNTFIVGRRIRLEAIILQLSLKLIPGDAPTQIQVLSVNALDATVVWHAPQFPNSPITSYIILASNDPKEDKSTWLQYESNAKETQINRMLLPTGSLEKSTEYFVCVRAKNTAGIGPTSSLTSFVTLNGGPDGKPENMKVMINEANQVIVHWNTPNSTTEVTVGFGDFFKGYLIYYTRDLSLSNDDYKNWQFVEMNNNATRISRNREFIKLVLRYKFDLSVGLKPKTFYRARIAGKNLHADGPPSEVVEFETAYSEVPIPTDLKTDVLDDNTIHIRFSAVRDPDDHSKAIDEYRIDLAATDNVLHAEWKHIEPDAIRIDEITSMSHQVDVEINGDSVEKNRMYWVKVTAKLDNPAWGLHSSKPRWFKTGHGKLMTSVVLDGPPLIEKEPNLSENISVTCTGMGSPAPIITWEWMNESIENGTEGWDIHNSQLDETTLVSKIIRNGIRESGELTCLAYNNEGNSTASVRIRVLGPGNPPENIKLTAYRNQINVTWQESTLPNGDIMVTRLLLCWYLKKYIVYYSENENDDLSDWNKFETAELETYVEAFGPSVNHFIRVQAVSDRGPGIISTTFSCLSDVLYEPLKIEILASNILEFEAEPNQNVEIRCKGTGKPKPELFYQFGNDPEHQFEEVEADNSEYFEAKAPEINSRRNVTVVCRASNKYENVTISKSARSFESMKITKITFSGPGEAPNNISWSFEEEDDSTLYINWNPIENPNGEKLEYNLYLSNYKTKVSGPPVRIPDIPLNVNISLRISAENEYGEGEKTFPIWIPTPNGGPKTAPILSSLHAQDSKVYITWAEPRLPNGHILNYTIYIKKEEDVDEEADGGEEKEWKVRDEKIFRKIFLEFQKFVYRSNTSRVEIGIDDGLEENERYQMKMTATNERHEGPETQVYTFDLISFDENDVIDNFTAIVINSTVFVEVENPIYTKYNIYIRDEGNNQTVKHEIDVETGKTKFEFPFHLDHTLSYTIKMSGMKLGRESPPSEEIDLEFQSLNLAKPTQMIMATSRRKVIKEPPL
ncbi:Protein CBG21718 [Caenorhabditis briggsae]|uniref:Protein CBG21718 n=1 Tax=Caenorhabditis briggsae TaxID=6238 RepID=B0K0B3_CAEBR|nr:Protein CBG21718 [Caenorhabditis briggsae]CAP38450.1 Protein CBG21718 [Caenorhabditis briggsae]